MWEYRQYNRFGDKIAKYCHYGKEIPCLITNDVFDLSVAPLASKFRKETGQVVKNISDRFWNVVSYFECRYVRPKYARYPI